MVSYARASVHSVVAKRRREKEERESLRAQAKERAGLIGTHGNSGKDWGNTAVQLTFFFPYDDKWRS